MSKQVRNPAVTPQAKSPKTVEGTKEVRPGDHIEIFVNGVRVEVSPLLEEAVHQAFKGLNQPLPSEMTTTQAAEFLDVSRPFVIKLIKQGALPCRMVGKHRRIPSTALEKYREQMFQEARAATDEITRLAEDLGLYELEGPPPKSP